MSKGNGQRGVARVGGWAHPLRGVVRTEQGALFRRELLECGHTLEMSAAAVVASSRRCPECPRRPTDDQDARRARDRERQRRRREAAEP